MLEQSILPIATAIALSALFMPSSAELFAGNDWNDSCYDTGFSDGQNEPFSQATYDHCGDESGGADAYYDGFIDGCLAADNTRGVCESATDA